MRSGIPKGSVSGPKALSNSSRPYLKSWVATSLTTLVPGSIIPSSRSTSKTPRETSLPTPMPPSTPSPLSSNGLKTICTPTKGISSTPPAGREIIKLREINKLPLIQSAPKSATGPGLTNRASRSISIPRFTSIIAPKSSCVSLISFAKSPI